MICLPIFMSSSRKPGRSPLLLILGLALLLAGIAYGLFLKLKPAPAAA